MNKLLFVSVVAGKKPTFSISGNVSDGVNNVADVTVALGSYSAITGADGNYTITGIAGGTSGSLTATKTGYSFSPITISSIVASLTAKNFTSPWYLAGGIPAVNCIGAYRAIGAIDIATSYVNLANPGTYDCTPGEAPTFDSSYGWSFNGSSNYLKTGIVPVLTAQAWSMAIRVTNAGTSSTPFCGVDNAGANKFYIGSNVIYSNVNSAIKGPSATEGIFMICGKHCFRNGVADIDIAAGSSTNTQMIYIGATSRAGVPVAYGASKIQALAVWNIDITAYQGAVYAAMAALNP